MRVLFKIHISIPPILPTKPPTQFCHHARFHSQPLLIRSQRTPTHSTPKTRHYSTTTPDSSPDYESRVEYLQELIDTFQAPIRFAFAYGSGAFKQKGYSKSDKPQLDLIFGVTHPQHWHSLNLKQNPHHYATLPRLLGSKPISILQERYGAGVYYNPFVEMKHPTTNEGVVVKYGVVGMEMIERDLRDWETLYLAGRMQKPIMVLRSSPSIQLSQQQNLLSALKTASLLHSPIPNSSKHTPNTFTTLEDLFTTITSLSYRGDFRMSLGGENPHKIHNIVHAQFPYFIQTYSHYLDGNYIPTVNRVSEDRVEVDNNPRMMASVVASLPKFLKRGIVEQHIRTVGKAPLNASISEWDRDEKLLEEIVCSELFHKYVENAVGGVVRYPALAQSVKGVVTAGVGKSVKYVAAKVGKWAKGKRDN